ncbi:unnamed protein product [Linum trigynum]|uniref:Uncharacterized protein n=1 Tax=Linum trigynum TaxID=586398 RepID=A0AAV2EP13_9ROSI
MLGGTTLIATLTTRGGEIIRISLGLLLPTQDSPVSKDRWEIVSQGLLSFNKGRNSKALTSNNLFQAQGGQGFEQLDKFAKLEGLVTTFVSMSTQKFENIEQFMDVAKTKFTLVEAGLRSHQASLQNLEVQVGNLVGILTERPMGLLPSQTIVNPKDQNAGCNAILLRNGKVTPEVVPKEVMEEGTTPPTTNDHEEVGETEEEPKKALPTPTQVAEYKPPLPFSTGM